MLPPLAEPRPQPRSKSERGRVLVLAPLKQDALALTNELRRQDMPCEAYLSADALVAALDAEPGAVLLTQEALAPAVLKRLGTWLGAQPAWSDLPLVLLLDGEHNGASDMTRLREVLSGASLTLLERPVRLAELVTALTSALKARSRQFELRDKMALQEDLLGELNHRVKNALANVFALFRMTLQRSPDLDVFASSFESRLRALSDVHQLLVGSGWGGADLGNLVAQTLAPYSGSVGGVGRHEVERCRVEGPGVRLEPRLATTWALCLHELATNAAKYGSLSVPDGRLSVEWGLRKDERPGALLRMEWRERGGPPVPEPSRQGFGTRFVKAAFAGEAQGSASFAYDPRGLTCTLEARLED